MPGMGAIFGLKPCGMFVFPLSRRSCSLVQIQFSAFALCLLTQEKLPMIRIKRVYEAPAATDGACFWLTGSGRAA